MVSTLDKIATLIDNSTLTELQKMLRLIHGYFLLKLITGHTTVYRLTFNREISLLVSRANSHRSPFSRNIPLLNMTRRKGGAFISVALLNEEFSFYFQSTHFLIPLTLS